METSTTNNMFYYTTFKGARCIEKISVCGLLRNTVIEKFPFMTAGPFFSQLITFLSEKEMGVRATCDFINTSDFASFDSKLGMMVRKEMLKKKNPDDVNTKCSIILNCLQKIMDQKPHVFLPDIAPKFVRLFTDDKEKFVMAEELEKAINGTMTSGDARKTWTTIDGNTALQKAGASGKNIEFLIAPMKRTASGAVATRIRGPTGRFCKLASDLLFEFLFHFLRRSSYGFKGTYDDLTTKFEKLVEKYFDLKEKTLFFMDEIILKEMEKEYNEMFGQLGKIQKYDEKDEELYDEVIAGLVNRIPSLSEFVHNQKACHRLLERYCCGQKAVAPEAVAPEVTTPEETPVVVETKKKNKKKRNKKAAKIQETTSEASEESVSPEAEFKFPSEEYPELTKILEVFTTPVTEEVKEVEVPQEIPIPETKESSTCQKCFRTAERCNEAKEKLKESENLNKKLAKKVSEAEKKKSEVEKELEELKRKFAKYQEEQEAQQEELKIQLVKSEEKSACLQMEKDQLQADKEQLVEEKLQEQLVLAQRIPEPVQEEEGEVPIDFEKMLEDLQEKCLQLNQENPLDAASKEVRKLKGLTEDQQIQEFADMELEHFEEQYLMYSSALEQNINAIQTDNLAAIIPVPDYPKLSDEFKKSLKLAQEQRNKELELECVICSDEMDLEKKEELFECPVCGKSVHLVCIETWFNNKRNCVHCRAEWK